MAIVHSYVMTARAGSEAAREQALRDLAAATREIAGSEGAIVLQDRKEPGKFMFLEMWDSIESRGAAGAQLPKEVMTRLMGTVGGPLQMAGYDRLEG